MLRILTNSSNFEEVVEPINKAVQRIEDQINNFLRKLKSLKIINQSIYSDLCVSGSSPGILYGLPKIHKLDFNVNFQHRPIFASYNCTSYKLSKFIVPMLSKFTTNEFSVKNSASFANEIQQQTNSQNLVMVSFDIKDLCTSIPLNETITICLDLLFDGVGSVHGFTRDLFSKMLELSVFSSVFLFDKKYYKQTEGLGMGLPLSPTLANIFLVTA